MTPELSHWLTILIKVGLIYYVVLPLAVFFLLFVVGLIVLVFTKR